MSRLSPRRRLSLEPLEDRRLLAAVPQALADIDLGFAVIDSDNIAQIGSTLYFAARDDDNGTELWRSDGTPAGTTLVRDINSGTNSSEPSDLTVVDGTLFFTAREDTNGRELWRSDGTAAGTRLVSDIYSGTNSSSPAELIDVDGTLFFTAYESTAGRELYRSDGTDAGTVLVSNINSGSNNADPLELFNLNGTVYFSATDGSHGRELWSTDGTDGGTAMVADILTGSLGSDPQELSDFSGRLFFTADDGSGIRKPWILSSTAVDDAYAAATNQELVVSAADGVLANDVNVNPSSAVLVRGTNHGTVALNADGSFTYRPLADFIGTDTFTYQAQDSRANSNVATVTIFVTESLGPIVQLDVEGVNPATADLWYSIETTRPGFLTIEATPAGSPTSVELALFDSTDFTGTPLATSTIVADATNPLTQSPDVSTTTTTGLAAIPIPGSLDPFGTYRYRITYADALIDVPAANESPASAVVGPVTLDGTQDSVALTDVPIDPDSQAVSRRVYRSDDGGATYHFVGEIADNVTTTFVDQLSEADAAANPELTDTVVGNPRIDWTVDGAGQTFYVCVTGTASDVDLRFANLVEQDGNLVTVYGTENDDTFDFTPGDTTHLVTINDLQYQFDAAEVDEVVFEADQWVTENVDLSGTLLATGDIADTAEILETEVLYDDEVFGTPDDTVTTAIAPVPDVAAVTGTPGTGGSLTENTTYQYKLVDFDPTTGSEGTPSATIDVTLAVGENEVTLNDLPIDGSGIYSQQRIYRNTPSSPGVFFLVGTQTNATTFNDTTSDAVLEAADRRLDETLLTDTFTYHVTFVDDAGRESEPSAAIPATVAGGRIQLRDLPEADSGIIADHPGDGWTKRRIYRNIPSVDATEFRRIAEINDATTAGLTYTDSATDASLVDNAEIDFNGPRIADVTLLVDVVREDRTSVFEPGTLQLTGEKGGQALATKELEITDSTAVAELLDFIEQALGIQPVPPGGTADPIPPSLDPVPGDPTNMTDPGVTAVDGQIRLVGNNGTANAVAINPGDLQLVTDIGTDPVDLPFTSTQAAVGEGTSVDFTVTDFQKVPLDVRVTMVLEASDASSTTWRWFADSADNDPATGVGIAVGTGLATFDATGDFVSATEATVSIDRNTALPGNSLEFELDFSGITAPNAGASVLTSSTGGGSDTANLNDSSRNDDFVGNPNFGSLSSSRYSVTVNGPENINVFATAGGVDEAKLFDSTGNDEFVGKSDFAQLAGTGFDNRVYGFDGVHAYASNGGIDEAKMFDSAGDDTFYAEPISSALFGTGFFNRVKFFDGVHAYATGGGTDTALMFDSDQDDIFVATPESSALFGTGFFNRAKFFEEVFAEAANGGNDRAELYDSALDDLLLAEDDFARMTNEQLADNFQQAKGFGTVQVFGTTGTNRRDVRLALSFVLEFFGTWVDV